MSCGLILMHPIVGYWIRRLTGYCNCGRWFDPDCFAALTEEREWVKAGAALSALAEGFERLGREAEEAVRRISGSKSDA